MRHRRPTREAAAQHHARSRHRPTRSRAGRGDARPYEAPRAAPPALPYRSPRRSPQLPATAARNRSMWVFRLLSGSHITCDSIISGSRDMAAANGGTRRTVTAPTEPPSSSGSTTALSAHCAALCGALRFKGRLTARRANLPRSKGVRPAPSERVLPLHRRLSAGIAGQLGCFSSGDCHELAHLAQSGAATRRRVTHCQVILTGLGKHGITATARPRALLARRWGHPGVKRAVAARSGDKSGRCPRALRVAALLLPSCAEVRHFGSAPPRASSDAPGPPVTFSSGTDRGKKGAIPAITSLAPHALPAPSGRRPSGGPALRTDPRGARRSRRRRERLAGARLAPHQPRARSPHG